MAVRRKNPTIEMRDAVLKIAGMKSIEADLDLGNDVSVATSERDLADATQKLERCNMVKAMQDEADNEFAIANKKLRASSKKILPAVGLRYGTDSSEYEKAGGVRESERKRPTKKPKP